MLLDRWWEQMGCSNIRRSTAASRRYSCDSSRRVSERAGAEAGSTRENDACRQPASSPVLLVLWCKSVGFGGGERTARKADTRQQKQEHPAHNCRPSFPVLFAAHVPLLSAPCFHPHNSHLGSPPADPLRPFPHFIIHLCPLFEKQTLRRGWQSESLTTRQSEEQV